MNEEIKIISPKKFLIGILIFLMMWFLTHSIWSIYTGLTDHLQKADAVLIIGTKAKYNGTVSAELKSRLDRGLDLYSGGYAKKIIVSGEIADEVDAMNHYLIRHFIPKEDIIEDKAGYNTYMKSHNTKELMAANDLNSVIIVTQYYQMMRARFVFREYGISNVYTAHARMNPRPRDIFQIFREFLAYYYYYLNFRLP